MQAAILAAASLMSTPSSRQFAAMQQEIADLRARVVALEAAQPRDATDAALRQQLALLARVVALEAAQPRDATDAALRQQLALSTDGLPFTAQQVFQHAGKHDLDLFRALRAATIQTTAELGAWLRGARGVRDGIATVRLRRRRWQVTSTSSTYVLGDENV